MFEELRPVLVVDDDRNFRAFVADVLARGGYATVEAATGEEGLQLALDLVPSLVILDVVLPGTNGYAVCRELRAKLGKRLPIMFVSGERCHSFDRVAGILIGADDYLVKPFDSDEFLARVERMIERMSPAASFVDAQPAYKLTPREREVLALLVDGLNQAEIADKLYVSPKTVGTHIQRLLGKLGVNSRAQAVSAAVRHGLCVTSATSA